MTAGIAKRFNRTHGRTGTPEYVAWLGMKQRCFYPKHIGHRDYSDRGIVVCERYKESFEDFLSDIGTKPAPTHSIDRRDNDGHYSCGKCPQCLENGWDFNIRWATREQQSDNTRRTIRYTFDGHTLTVSEWARLLGIPKHRIYNRLHKGWPIEMALTKPPDAHRRVMGAGRRTSGALSGDEQGELFSE
jgi:hypothetical protein